MMPGAAERHGPVPGYRPEGSSRNGLSLEGKPYRFKGQADWDPWNGVHRNPAEVLATDGTVTEKFAERNAAQVERKAERIAKFQQIREEDPTLTLGEIAARMRLSYKTVQGYASELRKAGGAS